MKLTYIIILLIQILKANANPYSDLIYNSIIDITNPTYNEYLLVENYLKAGTIPLISNMVNWRNIALSRTIKLIDGSLDSIEYLIINVNNRKKQKENCIILYATFNSTEQKNIENIINEIKDSNYKGDIIKRIGGFPNVEEGDLVLAHLPQSYKICAFREALRLGYKKVLWIDSTFIPEISLDTIFDKIERDAIFTYKTQFTIFELCSNGQYISAFNITEQKAQTLYVVHTGILGFDLENSLNLEILKNWHFLTLTDEAASFTPFSAHTLASFIIQKYYSSTVFRNSFDHIDSKSKKNLEFSKQ